MKVFVLKYDCSERDDASPAAVIGVYSTRALAAGVIAGMQAEMEEHRSPLWEREAIVGYRPFWTSKWGGNPDYYEILEMEVDAPSGAVGEAAAR
jgi:hypothetical protein